MEACIIKSPLGFTKIVGDADGITSVIVLNSEEKITDIIPDELEELRINMKLNRWLVNEANLIFYIDQY